MTSSDVDDLIAARGGVRAVARALDVPPSTVQSWKTAGRIPAWRRPLLLSLPTMADGPDHEPESAAQ